MSASNCRNDPSPFQGCTATERPARLTAPAITGRGGLSIERPRDTLDFPCVSVFPASVASSSVDRALAVVRTPVRPNFTTLGAQSMLARVRPRPAEEEMVAAIALTCGWL